MSRTPSRLAACLAATLLAGCIDYSETLEMRADGSGTLTIRQTIDLSVLENVKKLASSRGKKADLELLDVDEAAIRKALEGRAGLTIRSLAVADRTEGETTLRDVDLVVEFDRPESLVFGDASLLVRPFAFESTEDGGHRYARQVGISATDIQRLIDRDEARKAERGEVPQPLDEKQLAGFRTLAAAFLANRTAVFELHTPGPIANANVEAPGGVEGSVATWRFDAFDLVADSRTLEAVSGAPPTGTGDR